MQLLHDSALPIIEKVDAWLDDSTSQRYKDQPLAQDWARIAKVVEEAGEVIDALIGCTGQNPRKGEYGTGIDVLKELADVVFTGIFAMQHITKDTATTARFLDASLDKMKERAEK